MKNAFRPEFINRIDEIIVFNPLDDASIRRIADLMLGEVRVRIEKMGYEIEFDPDVVDAVSKEGFDPKYGARPLRRAIVRLIEDNFANMLLESKLAPGEKFTAKLKNGEIVFDRKNL